MKNCILIIVLFLSFTVFSQEQEVTEVVVDQTVENAYTNKGKFYFFWGWNTANYSNSDIHFKGNDYDFTLQDVVGKDRVTEFSFYNYFHPLRITIPQTNFKIGYFFHENYSVAIGVDHMKYVMQNGKTVKIDGAITNGSDYGGVYTNEDIILDTDFLEFEHTDGLNYINVAVNRFDSLNKLFNFEVKNVDFNITEGISAGVLYPKTNATIFGGDRYDDFHISGYGVSAKVGLNITFFKHFFIQTDFKAGYINLSDIKTTADGVGSASQHFTFFEKILMVGTRFSLKK